MALPVAKRLLEEATKRRLTAKERRHCIGYLMVADPALGSDSVTLAEMFQVSDRQIRADRKVVKEEMAKEIRSIDPALLLTDLVMELERSLRDIEESKKKAALGSTSRLKHNIAAVKLRNEVFQMLQSVGFLPKELGNFTVEKFEFKTIQAKTGELISRRVDEYDYLLTPGQLPEGKESEVQEAEFEEVNASPSTNGESRPD